MLQLKLNGNDISVDAPGDMPLLWVLRDIVGMTGTKFGCGVAQCGACTVHVDGQPVDLAAFPLVTRPERPSPPSKRSVRRPRVPPCKKPGSA